MQITPHNPFAVLTPTPSDGQSPSNTRAGENDIAGTQRVNAANDAANDADSGRATDQRTRGQEHGGEQQDKNDPSRSDQTGNGEAGDKQSAGSTTRQNLDPKDLKVVEELKQRDREVRAHEAAHKAVAGQHAAGGPSYDYQVGPDGRRYAVGGEVKIDTGAVANDPHATLRKAQTIRAAALAPAEPSGQDRAVAAAAARMAVEAQSDILKLQQESEPSQRPAEHGAERAQNDAGGDEKPQRQPDAPPPKVPSPAQTYHQMESAQTKGVSEVLNVFA